MRWWPFLSLLGLLAGCESGGGRGDGADGAPLDGGLADVATDAAPTDAAPTDAAPTDAALDPDAARPPVQRATLAHAFPPRALDAFEETSPCVQWTLGNDQPLYVEKVTLATGGAFHHSNWFVVPETEFAGEDGFFRCRERGFDELKAALAGTVLFAQSTQSIFEEQRLGDGIVIKVPPRSKVISDVHLLNLSAGAVTTTLQMGLEVIHPRDVRKVVTPFRFSYLPLTIPPQRASRFTADCNLQFPYERITQQPFNLKLYYLLPHYHELGDWFDVTVKGGPLDGQSVMRVEQFNAEGNGKAFDPPLDLTGAQGLAVTCGFDNPRPVEVGWGTGDQEMCVMLGFADGEVMLDASVVANSRLQREELGVAWYQGPCVVLTVPKDENQGPPSAEELAGPFHVPPSDADPTVGRPPVCVDIPADAVATAEATLENIQAQIFRPGCSFTACHGGTHAAAGLDLSSSDPEVLRAELLGHRVTANTPLPLVAPGDPEGSWLWQRMARCAPQDASGTVLTHMPLNAPTLFEPGRAALVRDWIIGLDAQ
jgi:hypothetical protein